MACVKCIISMAFLLFSVDLFAAHGLETKVTYRDQADDLTCHIYRNYIVHIYGESDDEAQMRIDIYKRKSRVTTHIAEEKNKRSICFESKNQLLSITQKWPHYNFDGIKNDYLFLDSSTSTIRTLSIYNLKSRPKNIYRI